MITQSVQTEVDSGYEGKDKIILIEAKNTKTTNTIIRQLYYPLLSMEFGYKKDVFIVFFEKRQVNGKSIYNWRFIFDNSIKLVKSE